MESKSPERRKLQAKSWLSVVRAYLECNRRYSTLLRNFDLTVPQYDVLSAVRHLGAEATPKLIADRLIVTKGNISRLLQRMQERGWLSLQDNERDGRSLLCRLTPEGEALLGRAQVAAALFIEEQLAPFDDDVLRETDELMTQMRHHLLTLDPDVIYQRVSTLEEQNNES